MTRKTNQFLTPGVGNRPAGPLWSAIAVTVLLAASLLVPAASADGSLLPPDEAVVPFPSVSASEYELVEASTFCNGEYTIHENTEVVDQGYHFLVFWKKSETVIHTTSIDYTFECSARFASTITGSGGIDRHVGIRAPAGQSGGASLPVDSGKPIGIANELLEWEEELEGGCSYTLGGCTTAYSTDVSGGETAVDKNKRPTEVCGTAPTVEAFNRPNMAGFGMGPLTKAASGLEETAEVSPQTEELCVKIDWEEVDGLSLSLDLGLWT